jgi:hypothetical protein
MSAPDTDVDKQKRKHAVPLIGMIGGLVLPAILIVSLLFFVTDPEEGLEGTVSGDNGVGTLASPPSDDGIGEDPEPVIVPGTD